MARKPLKWTCGAGGVVTMLPSEYSRANGKNVYPCPVQLEVTSGEALLPGTCRVPAVIRNVVDIDLLLRGHSGVEFVQPTYNVLFPAGSELGPSWLDVVVTQCPWSLQVEPCDGRPSVYGLWMLHVQECRASGRPITPLEIFEVEYEDDVNAPTPDELAEDVEDLAQAIMNRQPKKKRKPQKKGPRVVRPPLDAPRAMEDK